MDYTIDFYSSLPLTLFLMTENSHFFRKRQIQSLPCSSSTRRVRRWIPWRTRSCPTWPLVGWTTTSYTFCTGETYFSRFCHNNLSSPLPQGTEPFSWDGRGGKKEDRELDREKSWLESEVAPLYKRLVVSLLLWLLIFISAKNIKSNQCVSIPEMKINENH